jgi:hypothetical protein
MKAKLKSRIRRALVVVATIVSSPLWIPLLLLWLVFYILASACIHLAVWLMWLPRDKHILFVYSDSPIWHDYIDQHILPVIREQAVVAASQPFLADFVSGRSLQALRRMARLQSDGSCFPTVPPGKNFSLPPGIPGLQARQTREATYRATRVL